MANGKDIGGLDGLFDSSDDEQSKRQKIGYTATHSKIVMEAIQKAIGAETLSPDVMKHVQSECSVLAAKVSRSLNLIDRGDKLKSQIDDLSQGNVPNGVKPFKVVVDVPQLDSPIIADVARFELVAPEGTTYRQLKEKLHYFSIAANKRIDAEVMKLQILSLRDEIAKDSFVDRITEKVKSKSSDLDDLMLRLSLSTFGEATSQLQISTDKAKSLYVDIMNRMAVDRRLAKDRGDAEKKNLAKTIDKLKESKPEDLLKASIEKNVMNTLKAVGVVAKKTVGKGSGMPSNVNMEKAYTLSVTDLESIEEAVDATATPSKVFRKDKKVKVKEKDRNPGTDPKGKGKAKGKSKGQGKSKSKKGKGKGKDKQKAGKGKGQSKSSPKDKVKEKKGAQSGRKK